MALFSSTNSYLGLDIGTSAIKIVELLNRRQRIEVATYGSVNVPNMLLDARANETEIIEKVSGIIKQLASQAGVVSDSVIAALPSSIVFSTVISMPNLPDAELDQAVRFAARDIVPADLEDTVLGWSRVGQRPHMEGEKTPVGSSSPKGDKSPIFIIAAPKDVVDRYKKVITAANLELVALEVETFPLVRSLLSGEKDSSLIVDIGDRVTTYHIIDEGTPRVSFSLDLGGRDITDAIAQGMKISNEQAHSHKVAHGISSVAPQDYLSAAKGPVDMLITQGNQLLSMYAGQHKRSIKKIVLIGGGAKLKALDEVWTKSGEFKVSVGNPWRGLSYPQQLDQRIKELGPTYAVAIGLAQRRLTHV